MNKPIKPTRRTDKASMLDEKIANILEHMLSNEEDIGHRAVIRAVPELSAVSSITRDEYRRELVEYYKALQAERKQWAKRAQKTSQDKLTVQLAAKDLRISELEKQVSILTASHKALLLAVGESGGIAAWRRFFDNHQGVLDDLEGRRSSSTR